MPTFTKDERLCSKKLIADIFSGKQVRHINHYPLMATWKTVVLPAEVPAQVMVTVPKKKFKKAHDRNRLKRQVKESYRNQKQPLYDILGAKHLQCAIILVYIAQEKLSFVKINEACGSILKNIAESV